MLSMFDEDQVFRIDHYLGREAVQNLLAVRFANGMFEPVWNREHIDHVQIDVPETHLIEMRADFYDRIGAFRDMVVTHLFQVLGLWRWSPRPRSSPGSRWPSGRRSSTRCPRSTPTPWFAVRYEGYRQTEGVAPDSDTETFVALRAFIDNWRWADVPFYLRTGKRLARVAALTIAFNKPPRRMFPLDCRHVAEAFGWDHLTFELGDPGASRRASWPRSWSRSSLGKPT